MKKVLHFLPTVYAIFLAISVLIIGCSNDTEPKMGEYTKDIKKETKILPTSKAGILFEGEHKIYPVKDNKYFLVYISGNPSKLYCSFLWEDNEGIITPSYIEYDLIKFKIDETIKNPYIKFHWNPDNISRSTQEYIRKNVNYILVVTNNSNFDELFSYLSEIGQNDINNPQ